MSAVRNGSLVDDSMVQRSDTGSSAAGEATALAPAILRPESYLAIEGHITTADLNKGDQSVIAELFDYWRLDSSLCLFELLYLDLYHRLQELKETVRDGNSLSFMNRALERCSGLFLPAYAGFSINILTPIIPNTPSDVYSLSPTRFIELGIEFIRVNLNSIRDLEASHFSSQCSKGGAKMRRFLEEKKQNMGKLLYALNLRLDLFEKLISHPKAADFLSAHDLSVTYQGSTKLDECGEKTFIHLIEYFRLFQECLCTKDNLAQRFLNCNGKINFQVLNMLQMIGEAYKTRTIDPRLVTQFALALQSEWTLVAGNLEINEEALSKITRGETLTHRQFCEQNNIPIVREKNPREFEAWLESMYRQFNLTLCVIYDIQRIFDFVMAEYDPEYLINDKLFYQLFNLTSMLDGQVNFYSDITSYFADFFKSYEPVFNEPEMQFLSYCFQNLLTIYSKYKAKADSVCDASYKQIAYRRQIAVQLDNPNIFRLRNWNPVLIELDNLWLSTQEPKNNACNDLAQELEQFAETIQSNALLQQPLAIDFVQRISSILASPIISSLAIVRIAHEILSQEKSLKADYTDADFVPERLQKAISLAVLGENALFFAEEKKAPDEKPLQTLPENDGFAEEPAVLPIATFKGKGAHKKTNPQSVLRRSLQEKGKTLRNANNFMSLLMKMGFQREPTLKKDGYARFSFKNGDSILVPQKRNGEIPLEMLQNLVRDVQRMVRDDSAPS